MIERPSFQTRCPQGRRDPYLAGLVPALDRRLPARRGNEKVCKKDLEGTARLALQHWAFRGLTLRRADPCGERHFYGLIRKDENPKHHGNSRHRPVGHACWAEVQEEPGPLALRPWAMDAVPLAKPPEDLDRGWCLPPQEPGLRWDQGRWKIPLITAYGQQGSAGACVTRVGETLTERGKPSVRALPAPKRVCTHITLQGVG